MKPLTLFCSQHAQTVSTFMHGISSAVHQASVTVKNERWHLFKWLLPPSVPLKSMSLIRLIQYALVYTALNTAIPGVSLWATS